MAGHRRHRLAGLIANRSAALIGPLLFQLGTLTLLVLLVVVRPRRLRVWSPVVVFGGFLLLAVKLDLISIGALLILAGLTP